MEEIKVIYLWIGRSRTEHIISFCSGDRHRCCFESCWLQVKHVLPELRKDGGCTGNSQNSINQLKVLGKKIKLTKGVISDTYVFGGPLLAPRRPSPQWKHPYRQYASTCPEKTWKFGDNRISSVMGTAFTAQGRLSCILLVSSRFSGAIWVTRTMWSHLSLRSFYLSDQGIIRCFPQEE